MGQARPGDAESIYQEMESSRKEVLAGTRSVQSHLRHVRRLKKESDRLGCTAEVRQLLNKGGAK
jgi:hypothetical protein